MHHNVGQSTWHLVWPLVPVDNAKYCIGRECAVRLARQRTSKPPYIKYLQNHKQWRSKRQVSSSPINTVTWLYNVLNSGERQQSVIYKETDVMENQLPVGILWYVGVQRAVASVTFHSRLGPPAAFSHNAEIYRLILSWLVVNGPFPVFTDRCFKTSKKWKT